MAYNIKYRFNLESIHGVTYTVNISKDGYSGSVITRPLGKAPVLTKSKNGNIYSTTLELAVECVNDGEYAEFYTTDPGAYIVALFRNNVQIWQGALVTELYSAPEIAPPYDVRIVANDGIAGAKDFVFTAQGDITPKALVRYLLSDVPALGRSIYIISGIGATDLTPSNFWNAATINLDYMEGKTKYEVLNYFLGTIHASITTHNGNWLIVRETDVTISSGALPCLLAARNSSSITSTTITGAVQSVGQMGVADMWPINHMNTNVVPAKRRVTVQAQNHFASGAPSVADNGWTIYDSAHVTFLGGWYIFDYNVLDTDFGTIYAHIPFRSFTKDLSLKIKSRAERWQGSSQNPEIRIYVSYTPTGGSIKYYDGFVWTSSANKMASVEPPKMLEGEEVTFDIPNPGESSSGTFIISFEGRLAALMDAELYTSLGNGYQDTIHIDNGARGDGDTVAIAGSRISDTDLMATSFLQGVFLLPSSAPAQNFYDNNFSGTGMSFMSLTALGYALSIALPRLELTGTFDVPTDVSTVPLVLTYGGVDYWVDTFDFNVLEEELKVTAISLPSATLTVESEVVTELSDDQVTNPSTSGGGSGSGGGGGGGTTVSISDVATSGGEIAKLTINGTTTSIKNKVEWGSSGSNKAELYVNNTMKTVLLDGWSELPSVTSSDNGKVLKVVSGHWAKGTVSGGDSMPMLAAPFIEIQRGFTKTAPQAGIYPVLYARHPAYEAIADSEFVLMVYRKRRGRNANKSNRDGCFVRNGWGAAQGKTNHAGFTWMTRTKTLKDIREYILHNYIAIAGEPRPSSMSYSTFQGKTAPAGFSGLYATSAANFKYKTSRKFGLAMRWENPEWTALGLTGTIDDSFTEYLLGNTSIRRWIYTDVAEFTVHVHRASLTGSPTGADGYVIGFELGG